MVGEAVDESPLFLDLYLSDLPFLDTTLAQARDSQAFRDSKMVFSCPDQIEKMREQTARIMWSW